MDANLAAAISPLEHTYKSITYTYIGQGLLKDGFEYDAHPEKFFPPKSSKSSKGGAAPEPLQVEKKPAAWWKAQCAFRGLNQSGAISDLQLRLKDAKKKMLPELKEAETQLNKEFKKRSKTAKDNSWKALESVEQKATKDPHRFLVEAFPKGPTGRPANLDIVVLKIENRAELAAAAEQLGLETVSVDAPWTTNKRPSPDRWIIVGRTRDAVWNQMRDIEREALRSKQNMPREKTKSQAAKPASQTVAISSPASAQKKQTAKRDRATVMSKVSTPQSNANPAPRTIATAKRSAPFGMSRIASTPKTEAVPQPKQTASRGGHSGMSRPHVLPGHSSHSPQKRHLAKAPVPPSHPIKREAQTQDSQAEPKKGLWDVTGAWEINCPEIENGWACDDPLTLNIFLAKVRDTHQMFAEFHFSVVQGVFRFIKPVPVPKSEGSSSKKRKWEDEEDEDGNINMDDYEPYGTDGDMDGQSSYTETVFHLGAKDKPTARRPTWRYRWRGRETGEGEIQLDSDLDIQTITFNKKGEELSGTFTCDFIGTCEFTGTKKGPTQLGTSPDLEYAWGDEYSEETYEHDRVARWH